MKNISLKGIGIYTGYLEPDAGSFHLAYRVIKKSKMPICQVEKLIEDFPKYWPNTFHTKFIITLWKRELKYMQGMIKINNLIRCNKINHVSDIKKYFNHSNIYDRFCRTALPILKLKQNLNNVLIRDLCNIVICYII